MTGQPRNMTQLGKMYVYIKNTKKKRKVKERRTKDAGNKGKRGTFQTIVTKNPPQNWYHIFNTYTEKNMQNITQSPRTIPQQLS